MSLVGSFSTELELLRGFLAAAAVSEEELEVEIELEVVFFICKLLADFNFVMWSPLACVGDFGVLLISGNFCGELGFVGCSLLPPLAVGDMLAVGLCSAPG